jgi:hypothetical protein
VRAPSISGDAFAGKPALRMPRFKYTGESKVVMTVDVDMDAEVVIVGQPENGAYEWVIVNHGKVERHSDCGYGQKSIALRDGLIAYHGMEPLQDAARAAVAYDAAIQSAANDPNKMSSLRTAEGEDLDALYARWISLSRAALQKAGAV